jgi:hypothetical protein
METYLISNNDKYNNLDNNLKNDLDNDLERELQKNNSFNNCVDNKSNTLPIKYGTKWSDDDKKYLIKMLKKSPVLLLDSNDNNEYLDKIAIKLNRSIGGIRGEIKKMIIDRYIKGCNEILISEELNIVYKSIKSIIKIYLEKECDNEIYLLEKENKLLKLKIENIKLRKELDIFNN